MTNQDKCPKCGAEKNCENIIHDLVMFNCRTVLNKGRFEVSNECTRNQLTIFKAGMKEALVKIIAPCADVCTAVDLPGLPDHEQFFVSLGRLRAAKQFVEEWKGKV